ncbi:type IV pilus biogenesis protein PilM [Thalassoroseus pseudoceratinae]|uniref:hypothetical protein n=1 Tax=Thalassoroseus pseudoceratinae TaxID=2713176 RepID=UPI0014237773|nr:hypothetical protein [Thalassoroseus pseudoceratinae]
MSLGLGSRLFSRWLPRQRRSLSAWGVDVGTSAIKAVQLKLQDGQLRYHVRLAIPRDNNGTSRLADELASVFSRRHLCQQKDAFAVVSFSRTQLDTFELPPGSSAELRMMTRAELEDSGRRNFVADCWSMGAESPVNGDGQTVAVSALSMSEAESVEIAEDMLAVGLRCRVLDGLPFALARAANWAAGSRSVAAIDLGTSVSTFVSIYNGRPRMIRPLRDCSTTELLRRLADRLNLPIEECRLLLPNLPEVTAAASDSWRQLLHSVTDAYLNHLGQELTRTLAYLDRNPRSNRPEEVWLFGAGATWPGLRKKLEPLVGRPVRCWSLEPSATDSVPEEAIFGPAAAMAMLSLSDQTRTRRARS